MNTLLIVVAVIFLASVLIAYKKGFVKIAASLAATIISILLVMLVSPYVSGWIQEHTPLQETVQEKCGEMFEANTEGVENVSQEAQFSAIESVGLPKIFEDMLKVNNNDEVYEALGVSSFVDYIGAYIAKLIADLIAFLVTFILSGIIVRIAIRMLGVIDKIPLIGGINHVLGGVVGIGIGIFIIWVLFIVITLLYNTSIGAACLEDINSSDILTKLYENNILMNYITKF